jgi:hypothetical protein
MPKDAPSVIKIDAGGISLTVRLESGKEELELGARALGEIESEIRRPEVALHFVMVGRLRYRKDDLLMEACA